MYRENGRGPKTDPLGTPQAIFIKDYLTCHVKTEQVHCSTVFSKIQ